MYMGNKVLKGEGSQHYGMRMSYKKGHPAEQYQSMFGGFISKGEPEEGDEPSEEDVEKAIASYAKGGSDHVMGKMGGGKNGTDNKADREAMNKGEGLSEDDLVKALTALKGAADSSAPQTRKDELMAKSANAPLTSEESVELVGILNGGSSLGSTLAKSLNGAEAAVDGSKFLEELSAGITEALSVAGDRIEKSEANQHEFNMAMADTVIELGRKLHEATEMLKSMSSNVTAQAGGVQALIDQAPARQPAAISHLPPQVQAQLQSMQAQSGGQVPGALNKSLGGQDPANMTPAEQQLGPQQVLDCLETMFMKSENGEYGQGRGVSMGGENIHDALAAFESERALSPKMAAEVVHFAKSQSAN